MTNLTPESVIAEVLAKFGGMQVNVSKQRISHDAAAALRAANMLREADCGQLRSSLDV